MTHSLALSVDDVAKHVARLAGAAYGGGGAASTRAAHCGIEVCLVINSFFKSGQITYVSCSETRCLRRTFQKMFFFFENFLEEERVAASR